MSTVSVASTATSTTWMMRRAGVELNVSMVTTMFTDDRIRLSRPAYYVTFNARSLSAEPHTVELYLDASGEHAVSLPSTPLRWKPWPTPVKGLVGAQIGAAEQQVLNVSRASQARDDMISWGWLHLAAPAGGRAAVYAGSLRACRTAFSASGRLPTGADDRQPRAVFDDLPGLCASTGAVTVGPEVRHFPAQFPPF